MSENLQELCCSDTLELYTQCTTFVDILRWRARHQPGQRAYTFLKDGEVEESSITYAQLDQRARCIATTLQKHVERGGRALLLYQPGLEYIAAFFGCLYAGVVAVPAYPPSSNRSFPRIQAVATDAHAVVALTSQYVLSKVSQWAAALPGSFQWIATDALDKHVETIVESGAGVVGATPTMNRGAAGCPAPTAQMLAFLQYTSGSTGSPKGVMVSHGNLMHNAAMMRERWGCSSQSVGVSWLPIFHDMGLIAGVLLPLYTGFPAILMAPAAFVQRPMRWLQAISHYRGTVSYAPNFAYALCVRKMAGQDLGQLDLRSWSVAVNGAEPVRAETLEQFVATFEPHGFRRETLVSGYGLAEATLMVSCRPLHAGSKAIALDRTRLEQHCVIPGKSEAGITQTLVSCGPGAQDQRIAIVDPETLMECDRDKVGEIWVSGPSVAQGYWQRPEETQHTFRAYLAGNGEGPFLRTGDLGFVHEGEIFITGRLKDVIIIRGRNHYPQDVELTVEQTHRALRPGCGAAFTLEIAGEEHLVIVHELDRENGKRNLDEIFAAIHHAVWECHELRAMMIVLVKHGSIPKTSSGKIQRRTCRQQLLAGELSVIEVNVQKQSPALDGTLEEIPAISRAALLLSDPATRRSLLVAYLLALLSSALGVAADFLDESSCLSAYGLDSLRVAEFKSKLEQDLGIDISIVSLLDNALVSDLVETILTDLEAGHTLPTISPIMRQTPRASYPLSFAQEQLWFLNRLEPDSASYNVPVALHITGALNVASIEQSLSAIMRRHATLRTTFHIEDTEPVQRIHACPTPRLRVIDLQPVSASSERQRIAHQLVQQEIQQSFNLSHDLLLRVTLLSLTKEEHILLLTIHHIISDALSIGCLMKEFVAHYSASQTTTPPQVPQLSAQYVDYALWQRKRFQSEELATQMAYWERQLDNVPALKFPTDRPRPTVQSYRGATLRFVIPEEVKQRYQELCNQEGTTLFMAFLAVFQLMLAWYSGQEDIVVGTATANRPKAELQPLIGYFINMLVLRTHISSRASFRELLQAVRKTCLEAYGHQDIPFTKLVEQLRPERDPGCNPLFQYCFSWRHDVLADLEIADLMLRPYEVRPDTSIFDLNMEIVDSKQALAGLVEYNTDLFETTTIERFIAHFQHILTLLLAHPDQKITTLAFLPPTEYRQVLEEWNATQKTYSSGSHFQQYLDRHTAQAPDRIAVVFEDEQLTYAQLDQLANRLAHYLRERGVGPEALVGVHMRRSVELVVTLLAIWKAGGAYVPLDPSYPQERLAFMVQDARIDILVTQQAKAAGGTGAIPGGCPTSISIEAIWESLFEQPAIAPERTVVPENTAYVIYTSGSTGTPKGVMITHCGLLNYLLWAVEAYEVAEGNGAPLASSLAFDLSVTALFTPLLAGRPVTLLPERVGGEGLEDTLNEARHYSLVKLTPAHLEILSQRVVPDHADSSTRYFVIGGEQIYFNSLALWRTYAPETRLINEYGPTETVVGCCIYQVRLDDPTNGPVPIGKPIANTRLYVLDKHLRPVPIGASGELYIGGTGVARSYLARPALTAERFVPDPFSVHPGERLYKTGDLAKYRRDGTLEFLGRVDRQVKVSGYRIELGEIEAALLQHPAIAECVLLVRKDVAGEDQRLVAYVVNHQAETRPTKQELYDYLRTKLPHYMIPSYFVFLDALPLTHNGKVDQKALPAPGERQEDGAAQHDPFQTPVEELLAKIWCEVLGCRDVRPEDNFFVSGGHSLLATRLLARVQSLLHVELPIRCLFEEPTLAGLVRRVVQEQRKGLGQRVLPLVPVSRTEPPALSFAQQRLWFLDQLEPGNIAYLVPGAWRLQGELDSAALQRSLGTLVERHESLRTTFALREERPVQLIHASGMLDVPVIDLSALQQNEGEDEWRRLAGQEGQRPCDLVAGPLLRVALVRLAARTHILLVTAHHIIADGWSSEIFSRELAACYAAFAQGLPSPLPPLPIQYADFALWQRQCLEGSAMEQQLAYWQEQLRGSVALDLPIDHSRPTVQTFGGASQSRLLPTALYQQLLELGQSQGVTPFMLLLAAFQVLLARYSGQDDICVGTPIANRTRAEVEGLIGFFVNTLVLRSDLSDNPSFLQLLERVRKTSLDAYVHQDVPFEQLVEVLQPERDLSRSPLFQVMFVLETRAGTTQTAHGLTLSPVAIKHTTAKFDLTLYITAREQDIRCTFEYNTDLFEAETIERLLTHWGVLLAGIVATPQLPVMALPLLSASQRHMQLMDWNATQTPQLPSPCLHTLFEQQVDCTPDAIALTAEDASLTYEQLNWRANVLAYHLLRAGLGPECIVGIAIERSLFLSIGVFGILKAGAAYLPLDPSYPTERLAFMLSNAKVKVIVTTTALRSRIIELCSHAQKGEAGAGPRYQVIYVDSACEEQVPGKVMPVALGRSAQENPPRRVDPDNLAYVIYTSGSTGMPKGAMNTHRGISNRLQWMQQAYQLQAADRVLQKTPTSFDVSVWELFWPLLVGAQLEMATPEKHRDSRYLVEVVRERAISTLHFVPSMLGAFVEEERVETCTSVRQVICSGEALSSQLQERFFQRMQANLENLYGPTEAAVDVTFWHCSREKPQAVVPIGYPISNIQIYLLDGHMQPVPIGVAGELYIGGVGVGRGYVRQPGLTAERFVPNPFAGQETTEGPAGQLVMRLYRTGDHACYQKDGSIKYLGRVDDQMKIRGFRIELNEIEAKLREHAGVRDAFVMAREDMPGVKRLIGYIVPQSGAALQSEELQNHLLQHLPEFMIPAAFLFLDSFPLSLSGKIDRRALPAPDFSLSSTREAFVAPRTAVEQQLADIWSQVLQIKQISVQDNFFMSGGDSILSLQIVSRARQAGLHITTKMLFQHQTIAALAAAVVEVSAPPVSVAGQGVMCQEARLTPIQCWFFELQLCEPSHFNQAVMLQAQYPLNVALLGRALHHLLVQHDALRLRFSRREDGSWQQTYARIDSAVAVTAIALAGLSCGEQQAQLEACASTAQASLNLEQGPLLRMLYFDPGIHQPPRILLAMHHLIVDGVSWRILLEDLQTAYNQLAQGHAVQLSARTTSTAYWAERLYKHAQEPAMLIEAAFWQTSLSQAIAPLPIDKQSGENTFASMQVVSCMLSAEETKALLQKAPRAYHTQINDILLAAFALALTSWTGEGALLFHLEGHGREAIFEEVDLSRTVGWFTSLYPVVLNLGAAGKQARPEYVLKAVKEQLRAIPQNGLGYGMLRYLCEDPAIAQQMQRLAQPQISFNYLGQFQQTFSPDSLFTLAPESSGSAMSPHNKRAHLLDVNASIIADQLCVDWAYSDNVHHQTTIEALAERFLHGLRALIAHCCAIDAICFTPSDFPLAHLSQQQLDVLQQKYPGIEDIYPLSPLQEGLLFHTLYQSDAGVYVTQIGWRFQGMIEIKKFVQSWQMVVERHAILRTAFVWDGQDRYVQVVRQGVQVPVQILDWSGLSPQEQQERQESIVQADRTCGFVLDEAPLLRLTLIHEAQDRMYMLWSHHHLLLDGWSSTLILQEVLGLYQQLCTGQVPTEAPARPYRDYIHWLQQDLAQAEQFWARNLAGFSAATPLPVDRTGSTAGHALSLQTAEQSLQLSRDLSERLLERAREHQLTINTIIQGIWALLLCHYSGEVDVVFGSVVAGRPADLPGAESMVGLFINTLPVRTRIELQANVWQWLKQLQDVQSEARQYDYSPLVNILEWSEIPNSQELFESLVVFENYPIDEALKGGIKVLGVRDVKIVEQANYPLIARIVQLEVGLACTIIYDSARFLPTTIERLLGHWHQLLDGLAAAPAARLTDLPLLTDSERHQLLVEWNATASAYPAEMSLPQLFEEQVEQAPEAIALVFEGGHLTYRDLNARASQLACYLCGLGVGPEVMVGIYLERSVEMIVGVLGILKAGGAYVPLDPSYPTARLAYVIAEAHLSLCLTQRKMVERLPACNNRLLCLDDEELSKAAIQQQPQRRITAANLAYVMYTSGSTGRPKGVCVTHRNIVRLVKQTNYASFTAEDVLLQFAPLAFDASTLEIWGSLLNGARLVIAPAHTLTLEELKQVLTAQQVTTLWLTAGLFHQVVEHHLEQLVAVRQVLAGGDVLSVKHVRKFLAQKGGGVLINGYGPTENTTFTCCYPMMALSQVHESVPIGRPIANTQVYILNGCLQSVPVGVPGELYIGGDGLGRGYLHRADLTAERFVPHPFGTRGGERLYKTGDLVRYTADGTVEFLGRLDYQVKLRGFRIELEEIEAILGQHPAVKQAVVVVVKGEGEDKHLVAYVVENASTTGALLREVLRAYLQEKLPAYMVPAFIVLLDTLPLTPNGKVDRKTLPAPELVQPGSRADQVAPRTQVEELLAEIWCEVLQCSSIGVHDNFFEVGGHSLLAMRIIARVRETFQIEIPISNLFEAPTLAGLGRLVEVGLRQKAGSQMPPLHKRDLAQLREAPLSFAQQRLWFLDQLQPGSASYNIAYAVQLRGQLDRAALEQSIQALLFRHEILRTSFVMRQGEPIQFIAAPETVRLVIAALDLRGLEPLRREQELRQLVNEEARQPFDLGQGPLWRVRLALLEEERTVLLSTLHHIIADGWSMQVLMKELTSLYGTYVSGNIPRSNAVQESRSEVQRQSSSLAALPIQYADFAIWQRAWLQGAVLEQQMRYWVESLRGVKPLALPTDYPRPAVQSDRGAQVEFELSRDLSQNLQTLSRQEGITLFMSLLAAFSVLLARYSGQTDFVVGTPIANRTRAETEGLVGLFVNTLALRVDLSGNPTFRQVLSQVRKVALGAYAHQDVPFEKVVEALHPERDLSRSPLVQVAFVFLSAFDEQASSIELSGLTGDALAVEIHTNARDMILSLQKTGEGLRGTIRYNADLFEEQTINSVIAIFKTMLTELVRDPEWQVFDIPLFNEQVYRPSLESFSVEDAGDEDRFSFEEAYR